MMKVKKEFYLINERNYNGSTEFWLYPFEMRGEGYVTVGKQEVEFEVPDNFDPRPGQIAALEEQRRKAMADYQSLMNIIDGKIARLTAIEHRE